MIKWLLVLWITGNGPVGKAVLQDAETCAAVLEAQDVAPGFCVPIQVDNLLSDVVLYPHPEHIYRSESDER